jgi:hypothetical protein
MIHRDGSSTPAFPTPQEFAQLSNGLATAAPAVVSEDLSLNSKRPLNAASDAASTASKKLKGSDGALTAVLTDINTVVEDLAGMSSAWSDDDAGFGDDDEEANKAIVSEEEEFAKSIAVSAASSNSRILSSKSHVLKKAIMSR